MTEQPFFHRVSTYAATALRYWELRRVAYNAALAAIVGLHVVLAWPVSRDKLNVDTLLGMFILAVLANVAYCVAYPVDLFVQFSGLDAVWRSGGRCC
jgi:hypothetical protein